ncbi:hypothetical protein J0H58_21125 [bacterium]|nr:hypothetical protein [bacterium]
MHTSRAALLLLPLVLLTSCAKAPPAPHMKDPLEPDETSGVQGICVRGADRRPCAGARVDLQQVGGPEWAGIQRFGATTDAAGGLKVPAPPGRYKLGVDDPAVPGGKAHAPLSVTVKKGEYTEVEVDVDKLDIREPAKSQPTK